MGRVFLISLKQRSLPSSLTNSESSSQMVSPEDDFACCLLGWLCLIPFCTCRRHHLPVVFSIPFCTKCRSLYSNIFRNILGVRLQTREAFSFGFIDMNLTILYIF